VRIIIECPERILHLEAGYIYADCLFATSNPLQSGGGSYISPVDSVRDGNDTRRHDWNTKYEWCAPSFEHSGAVSPNITPA